VIAKDRDVSGINSRLGESAVGDEDVELILVLRGKVRRAAGSDRWRIRVAGRHVFTFRSESVVAVTPVPRIGRPTRR
jgi:hypothetical protein